MSQPPRRSARLQGGNLTSEDVKESDFYLSHEKQQKKAKEQHKNSKNETDIAKKVEKDDKLGELGEANNLPVTDVGNSTDTESESSKIPVEKTTEENVGEEAEVEVAVQAVEDDEVPNTPGKSVEAEIIEQPTNQDQESAREEASVPKSKKVR